MISKNQDTAWDDDIFRMLWKCDSWEELELTAAALGIDTERWLKNEGWMWRRIYEVCE